MTFIDVVASKGAVFGLCCAMSSAMQCWCGNRESTECDVNLGGCWATNIPACLQKLSCKLQSPVLNAFHKVKIFVWRSQNYFCWMSHNFFSEMGLIWSEVRQALRWSKLIRRYHGSCDFPAVRRFSPSCQPSMLLFILIDFMKTLHDDGGHVRLVIQVLPTYCMKSWSFCDSGISSRQAYISGISSSGFFCAGKQWIRLSMGHILSNSGAFGIR